MYRKNRRLLLALSTQQKFRFEILEIPRALWNGTFRLHRPDPNHRAFGYCACKQDAKRRYWGQQFCQIERDISVRPTKMTRPVKEDHLQRWSQIFRSNRTEMVRSIWFLTEISGILGWMDSALRYNVFFLQEIRTYFFCFQNLNILKSADYHLCKNLFGLTWGSTGS